MINKISRKIEKIFSLSNFINLAIFFVAIIISIYRIKISNSYGLDFDSIDIHTGFDQRFFFRNALDFNIFNALSSYPLIKNRGYTWFLLLVHYLGIDLRAAYGIFWIVAAIILYFTIYKASKNRMLAFASSLYLSMHPIAHFKMDSIFGYRNVIYVPSITIIMSIYILFYIYLKDNQKVKSFICSIILGLDFIYIYFLTETGIIHIAILLGLLLLFSLFAIYDCFVSKSFSCKTLSKKLIIIILPFLIALSGIRAYKFVNYRSYGVDVINMRTEGEVARLISNIQDIESDDADLYIWCSNDQIDKAYKASTTFQINSGIYESIKNEDLGHREKGFVGDFLGWGITKSIINTGISYDDAIKIFRNINNELEEAFRSGKLQKTKKIRLTKTLGRYTKEEIKNDVLKLFGINFVSLINLNRLEDYYEGLFANPVDTSGRYFNFYNIDNSYEIKDYTSDIVGHKNWYAKINTILVYLMFINIVISLLMLVLQTYMKSKRGKQGILSEAVRKRVINVRYLIFSLVFLSFYIAYILSISFFTVWFFLESREFESFAFYYASMGIVFLLFAIVFSFLSYYEALASTIKEFVFSLIDKIKNTLNFKNNHTLNIVKFSCVAALYICAIFAMYKNLDIKLVDKEKNAYKYDIGTLKALKINDKNLLSNIEFVGDRSVINIINSVETMYKFNCDKKYTNENSTINHTVDLYVTSLMTTKPILVFSLGKIDYDAQIDGEVFSQSIERLFGTAHQLNKLVVVPSYIDLQRDYYADRDPLNDMNMKVYTYDNAIRECAKKYENVIYLDCSDIVKKYQYEDAIKSEKIFYSRVTKRILDKLSMVK